MRKDLQKLLCEQERRGSSRSYKEVRHKKLFNETMNDEDFVAGREGMKARYVVGHGVQQKEFSENFNPLFGIIRKNAGRKWDDVFSELNQVFDMRNHVNAHILVHLWDFVAVYPECYLDDDGDIVVHSEWSHPRLLKDSWFKFYVDPRDGILKKNEFYESYNQAARRRKKREAEEKLKTERVISDDLALRRRSEDSPWFVCTLRKLPYPAKDVKVERTYPYLKRPLVSYTYPDCVIIDKWTGKYAKWGEHYCIDVRSASKKELKKYGLK